jgi:hypothetical protein
VTNERALEALWTAVVRQNQDWSTEMKPFESTFAKISLIEDQQDKDTAKFGLTLQDGLVDNEKDALDMFRPYTEPGSEELEFRVRGIRSPLLPVQVRVAPVDIACKVRT